MKTIRIILANAKIENGNKGCVALTLSAMHILRRLIRASGNEVRFYLPDSEHVRTGLHHEQILDEDVEYTAFEYPIPLSIKGYLKKAYHLLSTLNSRRIFKQCDYVFDIGQGDSYTDLYGPQRFATIDRVHRAARLFHKPYCLLPQTIGPFSDENIKRQACKSMQEATFVMARDNQSLRYARELMGEGAKISEYIDVAFFMPFKKRAFPSGHVHVGINISGLLWHGGYTKNNQFGLSVDYPTLMTHVIDYFLQQPDVVVHLIPHVVNSKRTLENDYAVCSDLYEQYDSERLLLAPFFFSPISAKNYISGLDFFIGARMHSTIAAFSSGVAVLPMAYSRKFGGLFADTLHYNHVADLTKGSEEDIFHMVTDCYSQRLSLKAEIDECMRGTVTAYRQKLDDKLKELLGL